MLELVQAGGWLMYPILLSSIIAAAIIAERLWTLQTRKVIPEKLMTGIWNLLSKDQLTEQNINEIEQGSPLGKVLAAGLVNRHLSRDLVRESIEETGRFVTHELEKFLNTLGTISTITPLLGLLGTVIGMIKVFTAITTVGVGDPTVLAGGISEALITTAAGLSVAIPSLIFYRYLKRKVDELVVGMEQEAMKLVEVLHGDRNLTQARKVV
ncbi:MAG: MotA/TolQ/ExbB proton channel family protein [Gammaproteobacteria bacterium]|nr:MotA/TolQ/ExbB proton channel family protein [Gammaproteobacteria bacterium]MBL6999169.1 MotA/TolQ/ExbB proton channel family protein [Gammaproteobacteria bacterium]